VVLLSLLIFWVVIDVGGFCVDGVVFLSVFSIVVSDGVVSVVYVLGVNDGDVYCVVVDTVLC